MAKTVMIVEDNELNMKLFNDLLEANGYDDNQDAEMGYGCPGIWRGPINPDLILDGHPAS